VVGATSRKDALDPLVTHPGRLDYWVPLSVPRAQRRLQILTVLTRKMAIMPRAERAEGGGERAEASSRSGAGHASKRESLRRVARRAHGYTPADLELLLTQAVRLRHRKAEAPGGDATSARAHAEGAADGRGRPWSPEVPGVPHGGLSEEEIEEAMRELRPALLRDRPPASAVPAVAWGDLIEIGGVKRLLHTFVVDSLSERRKFHRLGIEPPRGVLLYGPPGTGKTAMATAVAHEAAGAANFICVQGSELLNAVVGSSERAIARLFAQARACSPCVLLIDQIDSLAPPRGNETGSDRSLDRVLSQLLIEIDGMKSNADQPVMVVAATSRPHAIDGALLRPGRLEHHIFVPPPPLAARRELLCRNLAKMACAPDVSRAVRVCAEGGQVPSDGSAGAGDGGDGEGGGVGLLEELARGSEGFSLVRSPMFALPAICVWGGGEGRGRRN